MATPTISLPKNSTVPVADVAEYLLHLADKESAGKPMTTQRLHHLLYYCQGWHLAWYGRPLFGEKIEARNDGPFISGITELDWEERGSLLRDPLQRIALPGDVGKSVEQVWSNYRRYSTSELQNLTRQESPWKNHYQSEQSPSCSSEIPLADLSAYFGEEYRRLTGDEPGSLGLLEAEIDAGGMVTLEKLRKEFGC